MTAYLRKLLSKGLIRRRRPEHQPPPGRSASPVLKKVLAETRELQRNAPRTTPAPPPQRIDHLPAGSGIESNGNGKNVYLGQLPAGENEVILRLLDDPSLSLEEDSGAFDPYDHRDSRKHPDREGYR